MGVQNCGQYVTELASGSVHNVNSWISNVHVLAAVEIIQEHFDNTSAQLLQLHQAHPHKTDITAT